ncbi:hypothetical protein DFH28DRAFT_1141504 [Melampsora americana]|nr:hypothetical protein DFH28DRAFT_1141504 [Melampsora americana]
MKKTTSKFLSVLIPAQSASPSKSSDHQDLDQEKLQPHFKRKNSSESHHPNKRSRVTVHIPYTPDLKNSHRLKSQTNLQHHELSSNKLNPSKTLRPSSTKQDFSPLDDSEDENDLTPFETHSPGSTQQTTVSLSRPQSPTLGYDSDFQCMTFGSLFLLDRTVTPAERVTDW